MELPVGQDYGGSGVPDKCMQALVSIVDMNLLMFNRC
jgi:hypothetical protein